MSATDNGSWSTIAARLVAIAACTLAACGASVQDPARTPVPPVQAPAPVRTPAPSNTTPPAQTAEPCLDPIADGRSRLGGSPAVVVEPIANPPDLDGDGQPDVVLRSPGGRESTHLLYVIGAGSCVRFVGRIEAFMLGCHAPALHGLCDLWVDTWLMHGDRLRSRWSFDGTAYRRIGEGELVPGPRKPSHH